MDKLKLKLKLWQIILAAVIIAAIPLIVAGVYQADEEKKEKFKMDQYWGGAGMIAFGALLWLIGGKLYGKLVGGIGFAIFTGGAVVMGSAEKK